MPTRLEIETRTYERILLGQQLPIPKSEHPQAECGRNIEKIIKSHLDELKMLNNWDFPTFANGVDIQDPFTGDWEVKSRQIGCTSYLNIGAITTQELETCVKYNIPFEDTDFSRYACKHIWCWYDLNYKIYKVEIWDMSVHKDEYRRAYNMLTDTIKAGPQKQLQTTPNLNKFFNLTAPIVEPKTTGYFKAGTKGMAWELNSTATSWHLRVTENKLRSMGKGSEVAKQLNKAVELV